jgi:hypothetical protein
MDLSTEPGSSASSDDQSSVHSVVHVETTTSTAESEASRLAILRERQKQIPVRGFVEHDEGNSAVVLESVPRRQVTVRQQQLLQQQQHTHRGTPTGDASTTESEADDEETAETGENRSNSSSSSEAEIQPQTYVTFFFFHY